MRLGTRSENRGIQFLSRMLLKGPRTLPKCREVHFSPSRSDRKSRDTLVWPWVRPLNANLVITYVGKVLMFELPLLQNLHAHSGPHRAARFNLESSVSEPGSWILI